VIGGGNLREAFGLGRISLMAANAKNCSIEFSGSFGGRIVGVLGQSPVAGLAINVRVLAGLLLVEYIGVAGLASLMTGEMDWPGRDLG